MQHVTPYHTLTRYPLCMYSGYPGWLHTTRVLIVDAYALPIHSSYVQTTFIQVNYIHALVMRLY